MGLRTALGLKRKMSVEMAGGDLRTYWSDPAHYGGRRWVRRAQLAARLCSPLAWVCDLGCGAQTLKWLLPRSSVYLPADVHPHTPDTEICDLNAGILPERALSLCDTCVMLGVLEYLQDPAETLAMLAPRAERLVLSYQAADLSRRRSRWKSSLTVNQLQDVLDASGYRITDRGRHDAYVLTAAASERFSPEAMVRRAESRRQARLPPRGIADEGRRLIARVAALF